MSRLARRAKLTVAIVAVVVATAATSTSIPMSATLQAQAQQVYRPGVDAGVTLPKVVREVKPTYTPQAMQAKIQGTVWLQVIVLASGDVGDITVIRSLDQEHGLDQQTIDAARQWKFEPGMKDGKAVPVEITIEMTFTLKQ